MKKIGLFGGTFNPIHYGHLRAAEEIGESFSLNKIIFIPASDPPHKNRRETIPPVFRLKMVRLAIVDNPRFSLSDVEIKRAGKSYSVETIRSFVQHFGPRISIYFILGGDAFREIHTWKNYLQLFHLCHFIIMTRPGFGKNFSHRNLPVELGEDFCYDAQRKGYVYRSGFCVFPKEITALDISSTKIRENFLKGRSAKYLMPPAVEAFIYQHKLYQIEGDVSNG
jgi:nicotinate-nucleotide adenylyltransferase